MEENTNSRVLVSDLSEEMKKSYLDYAMSVIVSRALPDVRDGLKPVHRRILYDMYDLGIKSTGGFKKCARTVGDVLGKFHPHGDASVYDALVRLAQDFSLRYPVIKPQGNFGSIDGDPPAAYRYTEAKMARMGELMLADIDKDTVNFVPNFDESLKEPEVLPAGFPFLLANGTSGIAVGMATNMPPHNLTEICDALCALIENPEITILELMNYIKGPDFPTYGKICGVKGIRDAFETGRGKVVMRGVYHIEDHKTHESIVFTEIPYQVNKAELVKHIDELRKDDVLKDISAIRDESGRDGIRIVIELKKDAVAEIAVNHLFLNTQLQTNFNVNNLALVEGRPKCLNLKDMLYYYLEHRKDVVTRRTRFDLAKAQERAHILLGLKIGLENIDEVIEIIKNAANNEAASLALQARFGLSEKQANAIIQMRLGRLSHMETQQIIDELNEIEIRIAFYQELLADPVKMLKEVEKEIREVANEYGDERRTQIDHREVDGLVDKDFIKKEDVVVVITNKGFVKRVPADEYKSQGRGGKGVKGASLRDEDFVEHLFSAFSHDHILFITNFGKAYCLEVWELPEGQKVGKGVNIKAILPKMEDGEAISAIIDFKEFDDEKSLLMATRFGVVKQVKLNDFINARKNGIRAIVLDEGDSLIKCEFVNAGDEAMIVSRNGKGLRFSVDDVRVMGRVTHGVRGINLAEGDEVIGLVKVVADRNIILVTEQGKGKQVDFDLFKTHSRGTMGQMIYKLAEGTYLVSALGVNDENDLVCITKKGQTIRTHVNGISAQGRAAGGVSVVKMKTDDDYIVAMTMTDYQEEETEETEGVEPSELGINETVSESVAVETPEME
ncbi:MAG: DNA topoisomerase (ATP-hydrolyzing) subunit A [Sphaerochaetaceae bacterium]|nr:DNA topoisomerase (ATP-hydrolyzing) subunit A [Sphaerochaetaceae bacterium]